MLNLRVKQYILWVYFLLYPLTNAFFPNLNLGVVELNPFRVYLLLPLAFLVHLFVQNKGRLKISKESSFLLLYVIFALGNSWFKGHFIIPNVLNYMFPVLFIVVFENLDYEEADEKRFLRVMSILTVIVLAVSLVQNYVNHAFYAGVRGQRWLYRYQDFGQFRNASIFRSIDFYQAGVAIGVLCLIFLFLNHEKARLKNLALCFMMVIATYLTYTRSNWIIPLIGFMVFVYFKPLHKKVALVVVTGLLAVVVYIMVLPKLQESEMYRNRVAASTYEGRFHSLDVYFTHFWGRNMLTGFGIDSGYSGLFRDFERPEVHNGYLEILFRDGFIGMFLYFGFWYYVFKRGYLVAKVTGNGVFIAFILVFLAGNFIYKFITMAHYGYHVILFYLNIMYRVRVKPVLEAAAQERKKQRMLLMPPAAVTNGNGKYGAPSY